MVIDGNSQSDLKISTDCYSNLRIINCDLLTLYTLFSYVAEYQTTVGVRISHRRDHLNNH